MLAHVLVIVVACLPTSPGICFSSGYWYTCSESIAEIQVNDIPCFSHAHCSRRLTQQQLSTAGHSVSAVEPSPCPSWELLLHSFPFWLTACVFAELFSGLLPVALPPGALPLSPVPDVFSSEQHVFAGTGTCLSPGRYRR